MKKMKFKVGSPEHSRKIQDALFAVGYGWCDGSRQEHKYEAASYLYATASDKNISFGNFDGVFAAYEAEEYFEVNGNLLPLSYWTQPATANIPERYKNPVTAEDKAMKAAYDEITGYKETTYEPLPTPPLGLKPRKLHNEARIIDILEAMTRYVEAGKPIDQDWLDELNCLIMENQ